MCSARCLLRLSMLFHSAARWLSESGQPGTGQYMRPWAKDPDSSKRLRCDAPGGEELGRAAVLEAAGPSVSFADTPSA